ncbi:MAG: LacI family DNA-binding transcriptional regulator [Kosmotogaceae bacterium]
MAYVTLKDIAQSLNISVSTVSRALNNKGDIDPETKKMVKNKARDLGYFPNTAAKALKGKNSLLLGVIIDDNANPFYAEVLKGMEKAARKKGFHLILVNTAGRLDEQKFAVDFLQSRGVDGILLAPVRDDQPKDLEYFRVPFVIVGRHFEKADLLEIYNDDETGGYIATKRLLEKGKRNLLHICSRLNIFPSRARLNGFKKALKEYNLESSRRIIEISNGPEEVNDKLKTFIEQNGKVDGIFAFNDLYAMEALKVVNDMKLKVPEDIAIIGYDDIPYVRYTSPMLTTVSLNEVWIGEKSVELLLKSIEHKIIRKKRYIQTPVLNIRDSG